MKKLMLRIRIEIVEEDRVNVEMFDLNIRHDQLQEYAVSILRGDTLSVHRWSGSGKIFSRAQYESMRANLLLAGLIENKGTNIGYTITPVGKLFFKSLAEGKYEQEIVEDKYFDNIEAARTDKGGIVYVITFDNIHFKIGKTTNLYDRIRTLQTGMPDRIRVVIAVEVDDCTIIETNLHRFLSDKNTGGEWYILSQSDINDIVRFLESNRHSLVEQLFML